MTSRAGESSTTAFRQLPLVSAKGVKQKSGFAAIIDSPSNSFTMFGQQLARAALLAGRHRGLNLLDEIVETLVQNSDDARRPAFTHSTVRVSLTFGPDALRAENLRVGERRTHGTETSDRRCAMCRSAQPTTAAEPREKNRVSYLSPSHRSNGLNWPLYRTGVGTPSFQYASLPSAASVSIHVERNVWSTAIGSTSKRAR